MVPWFYGSIVICDCSAVQSAVCLSKCLVTAPVFLLGATRHFVLLLCKICAEIVVYRMLAVFLNGLNGKNCSRRIVRNIFSVYFFYSGFKISYSEYSFVTQIVVSVIRIVSYISERHVLYIFRTCEWTSFGLNVICSQLISSILCTMIVRWRNSLSALLLF